MYPESVKMTIQYTLRENSLYISMFLKIGQNDRLEMLNIFICQSLCNIHASASISISQYTKSSRKSPYNSRICSYILIRGLFS